MLNNKSKNNKGKLVSGFTLVETLFAVFILTFVIVGLMTVVANNLFVARYARDEITANYLLQEVVDYIRNDRDTKVFLLGEDWDTFTNNYSNNCGTNGCYFNVLSDSRSIQNCSTGDGCSFLYYDDSSESGSFYVTDEGSGLPDGATKTKFKRKVVAIKNGDELKITVTVDWKNGTMDRNRVLTTSLTNWRVSP